jgi:sugar phosphate isomerase/epimerase
MRLGIVSNCWREQLDAGTSLDELIEEAVRRGCDHVELRQGCLGGYERAGEGGLWPDVAALGPLAKRFPETGINLAMALPYLGGEVTPRTRLFLEGMSAAVALGRGGEGHLRLVDPETPAASVTADREAGLAERLASLASACADAGARLSVENARQPWGTRRGILSRARQRLGPRAGALGLCYDPCNLLSASDRPDPQAETARLRAEEIALFHYKQSREGAPHPEVGAGDIDWAVQLQALRQIGYMGARLFEIPAGPDIWERLECSRDYLKGLEA